MYTSDTCPKGVAAQSYLSRINILFEEINLDRQTDKEKIDGLWQLLRNWQEDPRTPLVLPVLTNLEKGVDQEKEEIILVGYSPQAWSDQFQPSQKQTTETTA